MTNETALSELLLIHEIELDATQLAQEIRCEVTLLKQQLTQLQRTPRLSQVRSLSNALAATGASDNPTLRVARLHKLVANQLERRKTSTPSPITQAIYQADALPDSFWGYVTARLLGLRSGNLQQPGRTEEVWRTLSERYTRLSWPTSPPVETLDLIHLRLVETFAYYVIETWEYTTEELQPNQAKEAA